MFRVQVCGIFAVRLIQELTRSGSFGEDNDGARHSDPTRTSKVCPMPCGHSCVAALAWSAESTRLASTNGTAYAVVESNDPSAPHLIASTDAMRSWHPIDQAISITGQHVLDFVVYPGTRTILVQVGTDGAPDRALWDTQDGGHTWRSDPVPSVEQYAFSV